MKIISYKVSLFIIVIFLSSGCNTAEVSKAVSSPTQTPVLPKKALSQIDLTKIKHITPQGRVQDGGLLDEEFNELTIVKDLLSHGKDSIPFLISKLDDETEMNRSAISFWYQVYVGDIALQKLQRFPDSVGMNF
jgi:hypothetical protein